MIKYSIIIPTAFDKCEALLKPCIESIITYTDLSQAEVIVVANGCTDNTVEYVKSLNNREDVRAVSGKSYSNYSRPGLSQPEIPKWNGPFVLVEVKDAIGYPLAINIALPEGEFIVPLNNDTVLLEQPRNQWLDILAAPFSDPKVAITGPWLNYCNFSERDFLIFFVVMIRKSIFQELGKLDTVFKEGYGEDCDFCCKAEDAGYRVVQVPDNQGKLEYDGRMARGQFPIYHAGNETFRNWPGGEELLAHNREILKSRYATKTEKALLCDGFFAEEECRQLGKEVKKLSKDSVICEIGSWHGRSTRVIADNMPEGCVLYAIDTWNGSKVEQDNHHESAKWLDGDHAYDEFTRNLWDHITAGRVIPLRMHSVHAARLFSDMGMKFDFIFLDAGHTYSEVVEDILSWKPLLVEGATFCGHDFNQPLWAGVTLAVLDLFGTNGVYNPEKTNVFFTKNSILPKAGDVYDCFIFNNEIEILLKRFETLLDVVDRFVIVEATSTHQRKPKPLHFANNLHLFGKYLHKVTHLVCEFPPQLDPNGGNELEAGEIYWQIERFQRDKLMDGLTHCKPNDIVIISDVDEIPNPDVVRNYHSGDGIKSLEMDLYYYNEHCKAQGKWCEAKVAPFATVRALGPCGVRYAQAETLPNGGKHLSYFGGVEAIVEKINNTAHREYNTPYFKDPERIKRCVENCEDIFERPNEKFTRC